jgi:hypothetical protein
MVRKIGNLLGRADFRVLLLLSFGVVISVVLIAVAIDTSDVKRGLP